MKNKMADLNRRFLLKKKLLILLIIRRRLRNHQKQEKRFWVRPFLLARTQKGLYNTLVNELFLFDHEYFFHNFRMTPSLFEKLVRLVAPYIIKSSAIRETCSPGERFLFIYLFIYLFKVGFAVVTRIKIVTNLDQLIN